MERRIKIKICPPPKAPTRRKLKTVSENVNKANAPEFTTGGPETSDANTAPVVSDCIKVELDPGLDPQPEDNEGQYESMELNKQVSETTSHDQGTERDSSSSGIKIDKKFKCVLCNDKSFGKLQYLNQHYQKVHKITWKATGEQIRANTCKKCGKVFQFPSKLVEHLPTHLDVKMEKCQICPNRAYKMLKNLKEHVRIAHVGADLNAGDRAWCLSVLDG